MKYPKEVHEFIAANVKGLTTKELTELVNLKFHTSFTESKMSSYKKNHGLKSGTPKGVPVGTASKIFPKEVKNFIAQNVVGRTAEELAELINEAFKTDYTPSQLAAYKKNHRLRSGVDAKFKKGNISINRGRKGYCSPGSEKGWFKKGHVPYNYLPVGSERVRGSDGYVWRKIAEPNVWEQKHVLVWEEVNGPIPEGHCITFLDRDKLNVTIENLVMITMAESLMLTKHNLRRREAELTKTGILIAKVKVLQFEKMKSLKKRRPRKEEAI